MKPETQKYMTSVQPSSDASSPVLHSRPINQSRTLLILLVIIIVVLISAFIGFQIGNHQKPNQQSIITNPTIIQNQKEISQTVQPTINPSINPTAGWKTYSNSVLQYTINYPDDWSLDISQAELPISPDNSQKLVIYKGQYALSIHWPSAYGPGICLFDDDSKENAPIMANYCEGEYVEFMSNSKSAIRRRLIKPTTSKESQTWQVYTKQQDYFVTVPPINYTAPLVYEADQINIMDQILSTFKSSR